MKSLSLHLPSNFRIAALFYAKQLQLCVKRLPLVVTTFTLSLLTFSTLAATHSDETNTQLQKKHLNNKVNGEQINAVDNTIERISVVGQNDHKELTSSGFNVDVLLTEEFKNSSYNLIQVLQSSPGINVRHNGGVGSAFNLSLNGLSGNQIRYFFDGIPMEDFGSALAFPANLVEQIQVYKGVVPVSLGGDALGGAVNVITPELDQDLLDLSYTYGSFNTHKANLFGQRYFDNGSFIRLSTSAEHSDNNYRMNNVNQTDALGNVIGQMSVKRFHDEYTAGMVNLKFGLINKTYADELSLGITFAKNRNNEQHTATSINKVFGQFHSNNETKLFSTIYKKDFNQLSLSAYLLIGESEEVINDTANRDYNWLGEYTIKSDELKGELSAKSLFTVTDDVIRGNVSAQYQLTAQDTISISYSHNYLEKTGVDQVNLNNTAFSLPNWIRKSVTGLAYDKTAFTNDLTISVFAKYYNYQGEINAEQSINFTAQNVKTEVDLNETGYGASVSFQLNANLLIKSSYENAYRMPEAEEILGTGKYVRPNPNLQAEQSDNINLGLQADFNTSNTVHRFESNIFYRNSANFIRYVPDQIVYGIYRNLQYVETTGIEAGYYLRFFDNYALQLNGTYQELINKSLFDAEGTVDLNYGERMPNEPYLFANARLSANYDVGQNAQVNLFWTSAFVEQFYLNWESAGNTEDKLVIPQSITHDIDIEYSFADGSYNVSLSARNIFNAEVFDNFNIEKPGRAFYLKFRYLY
ncbi:MAG: TonB-dependent receptor plug domain-containing protein [Colwellia sp.]|nr:TonB-dependent receptor plug domain-containing protein [Colwellia sp.]